jgi:uncharacterized repeat protein (TIGR03803 family)
VGGLILDQAGNLYGTTTIGGNCWYYCGVVFKLTPGTGGSWTENVLHSFCSLKNCRDGGFSLASLIFDRMGNLYGTTAYGGAYNAGSVFKLTPNSDGGWIESVLHSFCSSRNCRDGGGPVGGLIFDVAGNLYGTTSGGGAYRQGVVFELTLNGDGSWREKVLHQFTGGKDGSYPIVGLTFDQAGNLYGTANQGGSNCNYGDCGVVFKLEPNSKGRWSERVLHYFQDHPGANPSGNLIFDTVGNLYGTTAGDGSATHGSVFEIKP